MMKKRTKIIVSILMAVAVFFAMAVPSFAAADPNLPDPDAKGSITVHKYATSAASNQPGTGLEIADDSNLGTKMEGVGFTLYKIDEDTYTVTSNSLSELLADEDAFIAANTAKVGDEEFTDENGVIDAWTNLAVGYYVLVESTPADGFAAVSASIITLPMGITSESGKNDNWNYDIHVYPKNVNENDISKYFGAGFDSDVIHGVTDVVPYVIEAKLDTAKNLYLAGEGGDPDEYGSLVVTDPLDERLTVTSDQLDALKVTTQGSALGNANKVLTADTHYTVAIDGDNEMTITFTEAGLKLLAEEQSAAIRVDFSATINENALVGSDQGDTSSTIINTASITVKYVGEAEEETKEVPDENVPEIKLGSVIVDKVVYKDGEADEDLERLNGAEFQIAIKDNSGNYVYLNTVDANGDETTTPLKVTTKANGTIDGWGAFSGLAEGTYYLIETAAPNGYVRQESVYEVTISDATNVQTVIFYNQKIGDNPPPGVEDPSFQLPVTGGMGTIIFMVIGAISITIAFFLITRARKAREK